MAVKISELDTTNSITGDETVPVVQNGTTKGVAVRSLASGIRTFNVSSAAEPGLLVYSDYSASSKQANVTSITYGVSGGGTFHCNHANGTYASPSATLAGDITGGIGSRAYHSGSAFQTSSPASIHFQATEDQTSIAFGMWIRWLTTPQGSTTRHERGGITDIGTLWIHDAATPGTYNATSTAQTRPVSDALAVISASGALTGASYAAVGYGAGPITAGFRGLVARGTPGTPTASQADDTLAFLGGHGYGATAFSAASKALLALRAAENWTDSAQGTYATIETTPTGSTTRAERLRINAAGQVVVTAGLGNYADDAAAAAGGVPVNGLYRNGSAVMIRVA